MTSREKATSLIYLAANTLTRPIQNAPVSKQPTVWQISGCYYDDAISSIDKAIKALTEARAEVNMLRPNSMG